MIPKFLFMVPPKFSWIFLIYLGLSIAPVGYLGSLDLTPECCAAVNDQPTASDIA